MNTNNNSSIPLLINECVNRLIENIPNKFKNLGNIDLVLEGGMFNGSYLVGALYFLKEMEKRKYVMIERISGASIGAIVGFLYYIDSLDLIYTLYSEFQNEFTNTYYLKVVTKLKYYLQDRIPNNICSIINGRLYISYYNITKKQKLIKRTYKNIDDIINTLIKSCYIPFLIDKSRMLYKKKYMDGINAYIFKKSSRSPYKKILHMDLVGYDKFIYIINIKNETNNVHRIVSGLLDIHWFFIKGTNTNMCSFINDWNYIYFVKNNVKYLFEIIIIYTIWIIYYCDKYIFININQNIFIKIISKIVYDTYCILLKTYCF